MTRLRDKVAALEARLAAAEERLSRKADAGETQTAAASARDARTAAAKALEAVHEHAETFRAHLAELRDTLRSHDHPAPEPEKKKPAKPAAESTGKDKP